ncbi:MAG: methyl-accepting chemotaxis protein [Lachnospiraceae bacterium]|nr:methyl-accepting chemotaxis protein [Lachnospiraceae bacterium]
MGDGKKKVKSTEKKQLFKKVSIKTKILGIVVPVVTLSLISMMMISLNVSRMYLGAQVDETVDKALDASISNIDGELKVVRNSAKNIAGFVAGTYKMADMDSLKNSITELITENDMVSGAGLWFEPNVFDKNEKYMGPYWYKDGSKIAETYDYSNAEYDYFSQEYYLNAKAMTDIEAVITDPYYDPTSKTIMATCSAPIKDFETGEFIGCVTVDIGLSNISTAMSEVKVGKTGTAILTTSSGLYIYDIDPTKAENSTLITEDPNESLAEAGSEIVGKAEDGIAKYTENGTKYLLYYDRIPTVDWIMYIRMLESERTDVVTVLSQRMTFVLIAALLICILTIHIIIARIVKSIVKVERFASVVASGDYTGNTLNSKRRDEMGSMAKALDSMFNSNKEIITKIAGSSDEINEASTGLNKVAENLSIEFDHIRGNLTTMNDAVMSMSSATEEVNASVEEINASIQTLAEETQQTNETAAEVSKRAVDVEERSREAYENAFRIAEARGKELETAAAQANVVDKIGNLANTIAEIADQINLLSLNASIEAARAGEHGKGFAVVATEINKLATQTGEAVEEIQNTVSGVQDAFVSLSGSSKELLSFVEDTVSPDYEYFTGVGKQYGEDAAVFGRAASKIDDMVETIRHSINEVSAAIENIAESSSDSAEQSSEVADSITSVSNAVDEVNTMAAAQESIAAEMSDIVNNFKLK